MVSTIHRKADIETCRRDADRLRHALPLLLRRRQDQVIRRRQVEPGLEAEQRRNPGDHLGGDRSCVPARSGKAVSFGNRLRLVQRLAEEHREDEIARVHRPIGLNIGSRIPPEIAVATLAGLLADRNGRPGGFEF